MIKSPLSKHRYFQESVALRALNITSKGFFCFFKCQALLRLKLCQIPFTVELHVSKTCKIKAPICYPCILGAGESLESVFPSWCSSRIEPEEEMLRMVYVASFFGSGEADLLGSTKQCCAAPCICCPGKYRAAFREQGDTARNLLLACCNLAL